MKATILLLLISTLSFGQSYNWDSIALETQKKLDRNVIIIKKIDMENKLDDKTPQPDIKLPVSGSVLKIKLHEYAYHCGDGCCYNYGTITTINDIELPCHNQDAGTILQQVLEHLGYKVEIDYSDDVE